MDQKQISCTISWITVLSNIEWNVNHNPSTATINGNFIPSNILDTIIIEGSKIKIMLQITDDGVYSNTYLPDINNGLTIKQLLEYIYSRYHEKIWDTTFKLFQDQGRDDECQIINNKGATNCQFIDLIPVKNNFHLLKYSINENCFKLLLK